jgi:hypothetical protein
VRTETRPVRIYEIGDLVRTALGVGKVCKTEDVTEDWGSGTEHFFQRVWVQHKFASSENTSNEPREMEDMSLITPEEYAEENF